MAILGIIGCGAIGTLIASAVEDGTIPCDDLILYDYKTEKAQQLQKSLNRQVKVVESLDELILNSPEVIVEAASQKAVKDYINRILTEDIPFVVMSVGGLLGLDIPHKNVYIPSGAIGGLDALSSAQLAGIDQITLTTRKNTSDTQSQEKILYEGTAEEAATRFPKRMNVAATLALTTQPEKVKVRVISDPTVDRNIHEIKVKWKQGEMHLKFSNDPHPENPKTSALAAWSAINLLKNLLIK
ncbi:MAG: aspartate dehydrogenase domain-containing protein [Thermoproteota archaeon]